MIAADDKRHGTNAGYIAGCRLDCCRAATSRYHKALVLDHSRGIRRRVPNVGTRRRIEALMFLGYSGSVIAQRLGENVTSDMVRQYRTRPHVSRRTHERIKALFSELSMVLPEGATRYERQTIAKTQSYARRMRFMPPLAWDDIDDPNERPSRAADREHRSKTEVDEAIVLRVIAGERLHMTKAERQEVVRRLRDVRGWSEERIEQHTGIVKASCPRRYPRAEEAAA